ncbi:MAG TPA: efflux RND transporter periplasmic adaptor subunit [Terriglobales bacterium]|jgi:RND family efflux transporter MFP subunit
MRERIRVEPNVEDKEQPVILAEVRHAPEAARPKGGRRWWIALLALVAVIAAILSSVLPRIQARTQVKTETQDLAIPSVVVTQPKKGSDGQEIVLPANVQAFKDAPIYARTDGYLKKWYVDIGGHVRAGQLLAEIDTPEVEQQLRQARADLATAQANLNLSKITSDRFAGLLQTDSVSKQEADNAAGDYAAKKATLQSAEYNVKRLEDLQSFQQIYAPFDGIITARNTDVGALINSGSAGGPRAELFHIAAPGRLRVYVNVPEGYSQAAKPGIKADLTLTEFADRRFQGTLVRTASAIDPGTRTLLAEIDLDNPTGELLSGSYAQVHIKLPRGSSAFTIPVNALLFRSEGLRVATLPDGKHVNLQPIQIGQDYGSDVEVVAGLNGDEKIIVNPPDSIVAGEEVRIASGTAAAGTSQ